MIRQIPPGLSKNIVKSIIDKTIIPENIPYDMVCDMVKDIIYRNYDMVSDSEIKDLIKSFIKGRRDHIINIHKYFKKASNMYSNFEDTNVYADDEVYSEVDGEVDEVHSEVDNSHEYDDGNEEDLYDEINDIYDDEVYYRYIENSSENIDDDTNIQIMIESIIPPIREYLDFLKKYIKYNKLFVNNEYYICRMKESHKEDIWSHYWFNNECGRNRDNKSYLAILSKNENFRYTIIQTYPDKEWDLNEFIQNPNVTMEFIKSNPEIKWNMQFFGGNPNCTIEDVKSNPEISMKLFSKNSSITLDIVRHHPELNWDYENLTYNPNTTWNEMLKDPSHDWDWVWASRNIKDKSYGFLNFEPNIKKVKENFMEDLYQYSNIYWSKGGIKESLMEFFLHPTNLIISSIVYCNDIGYVPLERELEDLKPFSTKSSNWKNLKSILI